ncbi:hypothetical protein NITHO_4420003 [Nitrolancea hollandica Lb]|uniref:Uncharacterized protein n=1 Tax=Nitrolancea hollandica Lb TaxID=1129897 RepID=I4EK53_9BACT|nr:hypothetical protein NITHO_4420003 [Nitrolancea hollandica Lb]
MSYSDRGVSATTRTPPAISCLRFWASIRMSPRAYPTGDALGLAGAVEPLAIGAASFPPHAISDTATKPATPPRNALRLMPAVPDVLDFISIPYAPIPDVRAGLLRRQALHAAGTQPPGRPGGAFSGIIPPGKLDFLIEPPEPSHPPP